MGPAVQQPANECSIYQTNHLQVTTKPSAPAARALAFSILSICSLSARAGRAVADVMAATRGERRAFWVGAIHEVVTLPIERATSTPLDKLSHWLLARSRNAEVRLVSWRWLLWKDGREVSGATGTVIVQIANNVQLCTMSKFVCCRLSIERRLSGDWHAWSLVCTRVRVIAEEHRHLSLSLALFELCNSTFLRHACECAGTSQQRICNERKGLPCEG